MSIVLMIEMLSSLAVPKDAGYVRAMRERDEMSKVVRLAAYDSEVRSLGLSRCNVILCSIVNRSIA
jgi:hypothetical protein